MTRDWHATYLTDPRAMVAARERVNATGEDGWAAAYTLALTMPPASGSYDAVGARDVLVPDTLPDTHELARLEASQHGYYVDPNITHGNSDMPASAARRASPKAFVRPDLRCPTCAAAAGCEEETGMPDQVYRCPQCRESWTYVSPVPSDDEAYDDAPEPGADLSMWEHYLLLMSPGVRANMERFIYAARIRREAARPMIATMFGIPEELLDDFPAPGEHVFTGLRTAIPIGPEGHAQPPEAHWRVEWGSDGVATIGPAAGSGRTYRRDEPYPVLNQSAGQLVSGMLSEPMWEWPEEPETPEQAAEREAREIDELRNALEFASRNPTSDRADQHAGMAEARRRGYVRELTPGRRRSGQTRRVALTLRGRVVLMRLCRPRSTR